MIQTVEIILMAKNIDWVVYVTKMSTELFKWQKTIDSIVVVNKNVDQMKEYQAQNLDLSFF